MTEGMLSTELRRLYDGGEYCADLYKIVLDGVEKWYYYVDEDDNQTFAEFSCIYFKHKSYMKNTMILKLSRALQGDKETEELRFTKDDIELYDHFTGETRVILNVSNILYFRYFLEQYLDGSIYKDILTHINQFLF
jgi:hypothetical protein